MSDKKISQDDAVALIKAAAAKQKQQQAAPQQQQGTPFDFHVFWSAVQYCCNSRSRVLEMRDPARTLISFLLDKAIKEDDSMYACRRMLHSSNLLVTPFSTAGPACRFPAQDRWVAL
jgi:hypothetical protein